MRIGVGIAAGRGAGRRENSKSEFQRWLQRSQAGREGQCRPNPGALWKPHVSHPGPSLSSQPLPSPVNQLGWN